MKVGTVARATHQGLGVLAKAFYDQGIVDRVLIFPHKYRPSNRDWYEGAQDYAPEQVDEFLDGLDALFLFETVPDWDLLTQARARGIRITLMPMYEWTPFQLPVEPDQFICPSALDWDYFCNKPVVCQLPVPVDVTWRLRRQAKVFVHNAGNPSSALRNGTLAVMAAIPKVKQPARFILRIQEPFSFLRTKFKQYVDEYERLFAQCVDDPRVELLEGSVPYEELWQNGDVFVFPEKLNGLCLPLQEAYASGMLVMGTDRYPANEWLPKEPLLPVERYESGSELSEIALKSAFVSSDAIAKSIDRWYMKDIRSFSLRGRDWAFEHRWNNWRETYLDFLAGKDISDSALRASYSDIRTPGTLTPAAKNL